VEDELPIVRPLDLAAVTSIAPIDKAPLKFPAVVLKFIPAVIADPLF
jgi:hypothetical protein